MTDVRLVRHGDSLCDAVHCLSARVDALRGRVLRIQFTLRGELHRICIPPAGCAERADQLWQHTCFEAFVRRVDMPGYLEVNLAPSGAWQAYCFSGYRQGMQPAELPSPPNVEVHLRELATGSDQGPSNPEQVLVLQARVQLPAPYADASSGLCLGLSAIVEDEAGTLSYWAVRHAPGRADFHHPDAFVLALSRT